VVCNVAYLLVVILALLHALIPEPCDVGVVADVDRLVDAFQKFLAFKGVDGGFVGNALQPGLRVVNCF
jgi:hypothetical protein